MPDQRTQPQPLPHLPEHQRHRAPLERARRLAPTDVAIRTRDRGIYLSYCKNLARQRFEQGFRAEEVCAALQELNRICVEYLNRDPEAEDILSSIKDHVTMTVRFGCDQVQQTFEQLESDTNDLM